MYYDWKPYVRVAERRKQAEKRLAKLAKKGEVITPVKIEGRLIAKTFWGKSWCENLESYGDYASRLPRGRSYVRNGSVVHLQIERGVISAWVSGSDLYKVSVKISTVAKAHWSSLVADCGGEIDSIVELLQGRLSDAVMKRMCKQSAGLFPAPSEIEFDCSCPDWASMCKHVAAVLYGVGARLDEQPALLFALRAVNEQDLIAQAGRGLGSAKPKPKSARLLDEADLADVFGIDLAEAKPSKAQARRTKRPAREVPVKKKKTAVAARAKAMRRT
jgi:uncharacterized Zn finger protein